MPFVADDWLYFEFSLAEILHRTVGELRRQMSNAEFVQWQAYHAEKNARYEAASKPKGTTDKKSRLMGRRVDR